MGLPDEPLLLYADPSMETLDGDGPIHAPSATILVEPGEEDVELRLRRRALLEGRIQDVAGHPLSDRDVVAYEFGSTRVLGAGVSDARGHFSIWVPENAFLELDSVKSTPIADYAMVSVPTPSESAKTGPVTSGDRGIVLIVKD
ncbi:MAG TPA: hypothetical protein ENJ09_04790 [Planctomycetes bacterium]|nr:hypothetical protein [Planctomycetota bacterium]